MRHILIGCCLVASFLSISGFCQTSVNRDWFNTSQKKEDSKADDKIGKTKDGFDELKEKMRQLKEKVNKEKEENRKQDSQKVEECRHQMEERRKKFEKEHRDFEDRWQASSKQSKEFFNKQEKEFDQVRKQLIEELQKQKQTQEQEEAERVKEVITSQCGVKQQNTFAILNSQRQCRNCFSEDLAIFQDPQILVFMSFSVPDSAWISLSQELERVGGTFVLRGLPNQSFQALASYIFKLKEQGVNAPIQLDPKSFLEFEIHQVPAIVAVEEQIFDKVSGHISLKFALEKMAEYGETNIAKALYQLLKDKT